jgi:hypothetical protein
MKLGDQLLAVEQSTHSTPGIEARRFFITSIDCGLLSTNMKRRFNSNAATPVVPLPAKKSKTKSPGLDEA